MKTLLCILLILSLFASFAEGYTNPMKVDGQYAPYTGCTDDYGIGDPFVLRHNGTYYLYPSSCEDRVKVYTSKDLVNWKYEGYCTEGKDVHFAYAPEVIYWRGSFYMITSPGGGGHYILKSDSPLGVFRPITRNFGYSIDGAFYKLDDGSLMMLYPDNWVIKSALLDEETLLPSRLSSSTGATLRHWTEGPGLFRRGDWYYLTFTGNHVCSTGYQVAYASREGGQRGNFVQREDSTLLINSVFGDEYKGLGHSANILGPDLDSMYITYHSLVSLGGPARLYNLSRLFTNGGFLYADGPTVCEMPVPAMPDVYGDAREDLNSFEENGQGYFAEMPETDTFTQEVNFVLNGGAMKWRAAGKDGEEILVQIDQNSMRVFMGTELLHEETLPEIGPESALHTLRIEHTKEIAYLYVDDMRIITLKNPGFTAARIGAYHAENVEYSFMAATAEALGSSDNKAVKILPGDFSCVHALNAKELTTLETGVQGELYALLGSADYNVRIAQEGMYAFEFTVSPKDAGKTVSVSLDGETLLSAVVPEFKGRGKTFMFVTDAVSLPAGDHTLTLSGDEVSVSRVNAFAYDEVEALSIDFTDNALRSKFITYGPFMMKPSEGILRIGANKSGFALFGKEGYTDLAMDVTFEIPDSGNGSAGILLSATDVSYYDLQVEDSYFGYSLTLSRLGVGLRRARYGLVGTTSFESVPEWKEAETASLHIEVKDGRVKVFLPGETEPLIEADDANPFTHGLYGFFSTGKELTVTELTVTPLS